MKKTTTFALLGPSLVLTACATMGRPVAFYNPRGGTPGRPPIGIIEARKVARKAAHNEAVNLELGPTRFAYLVPAQGGSIPCTYNYGGHRGPVVTIERGEYVIHLGTRCTLRWDHQLSEMAMQTADAIAALEDYYTFDHTSEIKSSLAAFQETALEYRNAKKKPAFPEEARRYQVQAENAFDKKKYDDAIHFYDNALQIAPWWPEGRYNLAMIYGKEELYPEAVREMSKYLALVPNAPDARTAKDKLYVWEGELEASRGHATPAGHADIPGAPANPAAGFLPAPSY